MIKVFFTTLIIFCSVGFAQQTDSLQIMKKYFESFEYSKVINEANKLLIKEDNLRKNDILEIYRMKGISFYSINQDDSAKNSFTNILKIDPTYQLDTNRTSPKIVAFFNHIKENYMANATNSTKQNILVQRDTIYVPRYYVDISAEKDFKLSLAKSIVFPGWGHFSMGFREKGLLFSSLTVLALTSTVYFIVEANRKKKDYYSETDVNKILSKYDDYNQAYLKENISIISLALIWAYTQFDLLFISSQDDLSSYMSDLPSLNYSNHKGIQVSYRISF